jgi:hypothetical protein
VISTVAAVYLSRRSERRRMTAGLDVVQIVGSHRPPLQQFCQGQDSNLHAFRHQILSLARLPIPPPWLVDYEFIIIHGNPLKTRADYCANAIVVQLCDWRKDVAALSRHDKSRGRRGARQAKSRSKHMKSIVTQISFRVAGLGIVPITTSCSRTTAREDHSERPQLTKLQFAVTNRRSGRYGNTSRIWPSRSFRCTLRQKSG